MARLKNLCCLSPTDKIKDAVVAKVAMQASDLYADAYSNMQVGSVKSMWDKVCNEVTVYSRWMQYLEFVCCDINVLQLTLVCIILFL